MFLFLSMDISESDIDCYVAQRYPKLDLAKCRFSQHMGWGHDQDMRIPMRTPKDRRLEEVVLEPDKHVIPLATFVAPSLKRVRLDNNDALWLWNSRDDAMRIYFTPDSVMPIEKQLREEDSTEEWVSVSFQEVAIGRKMVEAYIAAWCSFLGLGELQVSCDFEDPMSGVQFVCGRIRGQMFPYFREVAPHLCEFAGLYDTLHELQNEYVIDCDETSALDCGVREGGVRLCLAPADRASTEVVRFLHEKACTLEDIHNQNALVEAAGDIGYNFSLKDWLCTLRVLIAAYRRSVEPSVLADFPSQLEEDPLAGCPDNLLVGWEWRCDHIGLSATGGKFRVLLSWEKVIPLLDGLPLERGQ